jgi:NADH-quinone oxidoreductase subunit E
MSADGGHRFRPTDELTAAQRHELIASMRPDDAERVPELHEVDVPADLKEEIETAMGRYPERRSAAIPTLWAVQRRYGWCSPEGIRQAAAVMRVTPGYLQSVASFYDLFKTAPIGRHRVLVCTNISCWLCGGDQLLDAFCEAADCDPHEALHGGASSADGEVYVTAAECLGACEVAPMASIDERYYGPLSTDEVAGVVERLKAGDEPAPERAVARRALAGGSGDEEFTFERGGAGA